MDTIECATFRSHRAFACDVHWALQYLEKALAAIFEAKNMARIGPCWRQLVPFIGSYHWPKRQCQASDKCLRPPGCKQKIVCESTRKREIFQNIKFKIRNIFTLLCQHGGKSYFTPSNDTRINYKSWEIRLGKNLYCLNWGVFLSCEKTIRLSVFSTWITASLFSVNHKISGPNLETL